MNEPQSNRCPLCDGTTLPSVTRESVPAIQNRVYSTAEEARAANHGRLTIHACTQCGYAFNAAFDPSLIQYDSHYNNDVPSPTFEEYYRQIPAYLRERYLPRGGTVID